MIIAVTGGGGFIGQLLVQRLLQHGHQVRLLTRNQKKLIEGVEYFQGDLSNPDSAYDDFVDSVDVLYHCAGEVNDESLMQQLHVEGTRRLVDAAKGRIGSWIQLSSVGAYGSCRNQVITEESVEHPSGVYEETKTESDKIVKESGIPYVILRPSIVFAATMRNRSLFQLLNMVRRGIFFYLGKKGALVNYVHVDDVVEALLKCGGNSTALGNIFNLSQTVEIERMVDSFQSGLGIERTVLRLPEWPLRVATCLTGWLPGFPLTAQRIDALTGRCCYDSSKIKNELGFEFGSSLEERFQSFAQQK